MQGNRKVLAITLISLLFCSSATAVLAEKEKKHEGKRNEGHRQGGSDSTDLDAPIDLEKFPGVGSIDSWKTSVPEFRAGMDKMKEKSWDEAIAHFRASIALYEYQPRAYLEIGKAIEAKNGLISDAERAYRQCVKLNNQSWAGWKALSNVLFIQKRYGEAREAVSNALNLNPPARAREQMDKLVQMIDSSQKNSNTTGQDTAQ